MSQRNRRGPSSRNNGGLHGGEEVALWDNIKADKIPELVSNINEDSRNLDELLKLDQEAHEYRKRGKEPPTSMINKMESLCRKGVKNTESIKQEIVATIEKIRILQAIQAANSHQAAEATSEKTSSRVGSGSRATRERDVRATDAAAAASLYDFDASGESPVRSPVGGSSRRFGGDRSSNRDSMPPQSEAGEPAGSTGSAGGASAAGVGTPNPTRTKITFTRGDAVAFRPRQGIASEQIDWILGEVAAVLGEGKSRRYKVMDIEPDEASKQREYRTSASNMIPVMPESMAAGLIPWETGRIVLALYPNTTTFYKAEVMGTTPDGKVKLKFEGESDSDRVLEVERRFVVEYRP